MAAGRGILLDASRKQIKTSVLGVLRARFLEYRRFFNARDIEIAVRGRADSYFP